MTISRRREAVRNLTDEGHSAREIADIVGVSHDTTARDVRNLTPAHAHPSASWHRREAVKNLTDEGHSAREIADIIGVSNPTISNDVKNLTPDQKNYAERVENGCRVDDLESLGSRQT